jgi:hypothetical protein
MGRRYIACAWVSVFGETHDHRVAGGVETEHRLPQRLVRFRSPHWRVDVFDSSPYHEEYLAAGVDQLEPPRVALRPLCLHFEPLPDAIYWQTVARACTSRGRRSRRERDGVRDTGTVGSDTFNAGDCEDRGGGRPS